MKSRIETGTDQIVHSGIHDNKVLQGGLFYLETARFMPRRDWLLRAWSAVIFLGRGNFWLRRPWIVTLCPLAVGIFLVVINPDAVSLGLSGEGFIFSAEIDKNYPNRGEGFAS